jgi:PAS domain S-box-containing protein
VRTTGLPFRLSEGAKIKYGVKENEITGVISSVARDDGQHVGWILLLRYPAPVRKELIEDTGNMERLKRLSKSIQAGYWENDLIQGKVWISDEIFGLYKIKRTSLGDPNEFNLLQKKINELIVSEDLPKVERAANDLIANYKGYSVDYRIKDTETGSTRYLKSIVEVHSNTSGHPVLISGVAIDLTWYYNYLTTGSFYGKIIENAPVGILVTDPAGIIQYTNKKITEMTGYEPQELAGLKPSVFKSGVLPPQFYENLWNTVLSGQIWQGDIINKRKDGSHYWDSEAITGIKGETGEIERLVAFKRDITQRKKYEGDLKKQRELFERLHKEKVGLLQDLNLEVRDPLNGVMGYLDLLADEITDTDHRKLIRSVKQSTERVINRLNSVADILNMESDSWFVRLKRTSIAAALEETLHYYQLIAEEKGLRFESYIQEGTSLVTDSELIAKATGNLLDNAIKFTREGSVRIEVLKPSTDENEINIRVTDTGPGIKKEEIEAIFSETSEMPRSDNSGFGLRLTREILKKLGGTIRIESVPGKRTSFTIVLSEGGPDLQTDQELEKLRHFRKMTQSSLQHEILLVEDSKVNAEVIALYLRKVCRVEIARSGEQGLQKAQTKRYSAVIMDINLGEGLSGIETMKEMKMIEGYKDIPFVAVTGYALNSDREKIMSEGFDFFFTKPLDMAEFAVFVKELVLPGSGG